jgi:5'-nucleotidase
MTGRLFAATAALLLGACATPAARQDVVGPVEVQILAINDFHGALEPPKLSVAAKTAEGREIEVPVGGAAYLAGAAKALRAGQANTVTVSAGDTIGATPLPSALFLDEPAIDALDLVGIEFNAVGNHEFDKGSAELRRMQAGGCEKHTTRQPCRLRPFDGASFRMLAANVLTADGRTLFPGTGIKDFGPVQVGFVGMTLKETATLVTPAGVKGLTFADEAATANAAVAPLKAAGADAIVLLIHQGARQKGTFNDKSCPELSGDLLPIVDRLDPAIRVVISGHTHASYVCTYRKPDGTGVLLTSAGRSGIMITDIRLGVRPGGQVPEVRAADNILVQGEGFSAGGKQVAVSPAFRRFEADPATAALVGRYVQASQAEAQRVVGRLSAPVTKAESPDREFTAGNLVADAQLAATRRHGAQVAFINSGGVRADLVPAPNGDVTFGQIFAMQPFGNNLVVKTLTGTQLLRLLEQQFDGANSADDPSMLLPSAGFAFRYDLTRPAGQRVVAATLNGRPIERAGRYRLTTNNFLTSGGDGFSVLAEGTETVDAGGDVDALEAYLKGGAKAPALGRIKDVNAAART